METVILNNGAEEIKGLVIVVLNSLRNLMIKNPIVFYEFVMLCRDCNHKLWGNETSNVLKDLKLIECNNQPHNSIRNIVLSSVTGDGLDMKITSPIKSI